MNKKPLLSKRFWFMVLIGALAVICVVGATTFDVLYRQAAERATNTVEYVKAQSLEYESFNNANVMKSQVRAMENASQVARDFQNGALSLNSKNLKRCTEELRLTGICVLDSKGELVIQYSGGMIGYDDLKDVVREPTALEVVAHPKKVYATRVSQVDGSVVDVACASRLDAPGLVTVFYCTKAEYANKFTPTLQNLLEGYKTVNDVSVLIEEEGKAIASNTVAANADGSITISQNDEQLVSAIQKRCQPGEMHLVKGQDMYYYGAYGKARDYYVYTYTKASRLLHYMVSNSVAALAVYVLVMLLYVFTRRRSENDHLAELLIQKQQYALQLEEAAEAAQSANTAKTEFLQRMSHDLRTPINGIRGMVEVGNAYASDMQKQAECREKVWNASGVLLDLVNEALDMSKLESGEVSLDIEAIDLARIVDEVCDMVERQAEERHVSIIKETEGIEHPYIQASALHLRRLLMNVATNAVKYNKADGEVRISCRELGLDGDAVTYQVTIADTGIGMSEEFQKRLFEPFAREMQNLDYKPSGTGLGMVITKQLTELMGGTIEFESKLGEGTTYVITIPFVLAEKDDVAVRSAKDASAASLEGINILLAEDNELNREIAEFVIGGAGATLTVAVDGNDAFEKYKASEPGTFDVILMDIMMPGMDGYETTRAIRALEREDAKEIPIVAMSANAFADDRQRSREAGMNGHLAKPLDAEELVQAIGTIVQK